MVTRLEDLIKTAVEMVERTVPVLPIAPRGKKPIADPSGSWWVAHEATQAEEIIRTCYERYGDLNLAILLGRKKGSPLISVDPDGPEGIEQAKKLGVSSADDVWVEKTGGGPGRFQIFYYCDDGVDLKRTVEAGDLPLDLLVDGYALTPPSITKRSYEWVKGPDRVEFYDLRPLPQAMLEWWQGQHNIGTAPTPQKGDRVFHLLDAPITERRRNTSLCKIAGWLHLYHSQAELEALLLTINDARCTPPLPHDEVIAITRSIGKYPVSGVPGFPKAAVPNFVRASNGHV